MFKILPLKLVPRDTADVNFISLNLILGVPDGNHWLPSACDQSNPCAPVEIELHCLELLLVAMRLLDLVV